MNPYCAFVIGKNRIKGQVCSKGGTNPHWTEAIPVPDNQTDVTIELLDKGTLLSDSSIGSCVIETQDLQEMRGTTNPTSKWYSLYYKDKPAGEILLETIFRDESSSMMGMGSVSDQTISTSTYNEDRPLPTSVYQVQKQSIEPTTFKKDVDVVETRPVIKEVETMEPVTVTKNVEVTEAVPVKKQIETVEPQVVKKVIEVMEPQLVTKTIQVVEEVPVKKEVEVVELKTNVQEVETLEPRTITKAVEVTEFVPVTKQMEETQPVTVKKTVEYEQPVTTTQTVTKATYEPVVVDEKITTSVGPATVVDVSSESKKEIVTKEETTFEAGVYSESTSKDEYYL